MENFENKSDSFFLLPAIDISDGKAVRLKQGELSLQTDYGKPHEIAKQFCEVFQEFRSQRENSKEHALWVHLVDLDLAFGRGDNSKEVSEVCQILRENEICVEVSGGIRDDASLERALSFGATRVNVGTAAIENPSWVSAAVSRFANKIAVGLDVRGETLAARGWTKEGGNLWEVAARLENDGVDRFVVTDVERDGMLGGPNLDLYENISKKQSAKITVSGGISSLNDIKLVKQMSEKTKNQVDSVIFGKALYSGDFTLFEALNML